MTSIGILEAGEPPAALLPRFGSYGDMFERLLGRGFAIARYDVRKGEYPPAPAAHHGYIVTGSPVGVYDGHGWIEELKAFLRAAKGKAKLVGICFGHQIMVEAFGGRVEKSERGWGIGLHAYDVQGRADWMDDAPRFAIPVSHQDQVVEPPPGARALAGSAFNPFGLLAYEDQPAISFQCHPEFSPAFAKALIEERRDRLPRPDEAIATLDQPNDRDSVAAWIRRFLDSPR